MKRRDDTQSRTWPRRLLREARSWAITVALVAAVYAGISTWRSSSLLPADGQPAPAISLLDLDGREVPLSDFRGKALLLHFWGPW